jgi:hypothetical protein
MDDFAFEIMRNNLRFKPHFRKERSFCGLVISFLLRVGQTELCGNLLFGNALQQINLL